MIKLRCPICNSPFLGEACPCQTGKPHKTLICQCGMEAVEVYYDDKGEWPFCSRCLNLLKDEFAPLPIPNFTSNERLDLKAESQPIQRKLISHMRHVEDPQNNSDYNLPLPFGLSRREYQIVHMYEKTNQQIAELLSISESTVASHWRSAMDKMEIRSRREVPYVLNLSTHDALPTTRDPPQIEGLSEFNKPLTFSLTITGSLEELQILIQNLWRALKRRD